MLKIKNFSKSYDGKKTFAVKNLSMEAKNGEIIAFIGHNGSGKTTTLKSIAGIMDFDEGDIFVDNISVKKEPLKVKEIIGYLPETVEMYDYLTGLEFLNFVADVFQIPSDIRKEKIEKYSKLFKVDKVLNDNIETYSHGMKQKVAVISLLIHNPKLLLLDEPFFGLDPEATFEFKNILKEIVKEGACVFYSTHVLESAEKLATNIIIINNGKIVKSGKLNEILKDESLEKLFLEIIHE